MFISEIIIRKIIYQKPNQNHENDNTVALSNETRQKCTNNGCRWRSRFPEGRVEVPLTDLTPLHLCACPKPGPAFQLTYSDLFVFNEKVRGDCSFC
jgi:hypothetical protein